MNDQVQEQLFVYGTLRSGFQHPAYTYISRYFSLIGQAKVKGALYDMGEYPAAIPGSGEQYIIGELYRINNPDELGWALAQLDDYEGVKTEDGELPLYKRERVTVFAGNEQTTAWAYWYAGDITGKPVVESGDIMEYLQQKNKI